MSTATEEPVTAELVPYAGGEIEEYRPRIVMAPEEAKALDDQLRANMLAVLHKDVDYGVIPGTGTKPTLLKPGAEKLLQWFGYGHRNEQTGVDLDPDGRRLGVTYKCTVTKTLPNGSKIDIATCDGYAGYDEDRFYISAEQAEAKERANAERYERRVNPLKFAEYRAPWNSLIKMAQKRSLVGATLPATSASSLFTQDMEDMADASAQPVAAAAALAAAGRAAVGALPQAVRDELDAWYRTLHWPAPDAWDAEQWCTALVKAGKLSASQGPEAPPPASGGGSPAAPAAADGSESRAPSAQADQEWVTLAIADAGAFDTPKDGEKLWNEVVSRHQEGRVPDDDKRFISDLMKARLADLRKHSAPAGPTPARTAGTQDAGSATPGTGEQADLDPEDPWAAKVETVDGPEDAEAAKADIAQQVQSGTMTDEHALTISAAIDMRLARLGRAAA